MKVFSKLVFLHLLTGIRSIREFRTRTTANRRIDTGVIGYGNTRSFGQQQTATGTAHAQYKPLVDTDVVVKHGATQTINIKHQCIMSVQEYQNKSLEELRLEDYTAGRKGTANARAFSFSQPQENRPLFRGSSTLAATSTSLFSVPVTSNTSLFGAPATSSTSLFGAPATSSTSLFGAPATPSTSLFSAPATSSTSLFGAPATSSTSLFGASATSSTSLFGAPATSSTSLFGAPATSSTSLFGAPATSSTSLFGAPATSSTSLFGAPATSSTSLFGAPATSSTSLFGAPATSSTSLFGAPATSSTSLLSAPATASTSLFGAPATSSTSLLSAPATASTSLFGAPATSSTSLLSAPATASTSLFSAPATASTSSVALGVTIGSRITALVTSCNHGAPNGLPPLSFHTYHSPNITISADGSTARYFKSSWRCPFVFSARPVQFEEKVCLRILKLSSSWMGLSVGFTIKDPAYRSHIRLHEHKIRFLDLNEDDVLYYYLNSTGYVNFSVNGQYEDILFYFGRYSPFWAVIYVQCEVVQFVDPRAPNQVRRPNPSEIEERLTGDMQSLSVEDPLPLPRYQNRLVPLSLHGTKGRSVQFMDDRGVAARIEEEYSQGYVFSADPVSPGQTIVVQILATETAHTHPGSLAVGLTSCDPATLQARDLPDDSGLLVDRREYWLVHRNAADGSRRGDELVVTFNSEGEAGISLNGSNITTMHVDHTVRLWAFVDLYGETQKVRMLSSQAETQPQQSRGPAGSALVAAGAAGAAPAEGLSPRGGARPAADLQTTSEHHIEPIRSDTRSSASQNRRNEPVHTPGTFEGPSVGAEAPDCRVCFEEPVDSALYPCGHICLCRACAVEQWRGRGGGRCPVCRQEIADVIYAYML